MKPTLINIRTNHGTLKKVPFFKPRREITISDIKDYVESVWPGCNYSIRGWNAPKPK